MMLLPLKSVHKYNLTDLTLKHQLPKALLMPMYTQRTVKKRIFRPYPWMILIGLLTTWTMPISISICKLPDSFLCQDLELSDISDFEDIMITSSDEDINALEAPPY